MVIKNQKTSKPKRKRIYYPDEQGQQREIYVSPKDDDLAVENFRTVVNAHVRVRDHGGELSKLELGLQNNLLPHHRKTLVKIKFIPGTIEERSLTLSQLVEDWFADKAGIKDATIAVYRQYSGLLVEHFGGDTLLCNIGYAEAKGFIPYCLKDRTAGTGTLDNNTVHRCFRWVKPFFGCAVDAGHYTVSPFAKVKNVKYDKKQSQEHVPVERIEQAIAACEDNIEFRLYLALGGYEGFRVGEMKDLTFDDFHHKQRGIIIRVPVTGKTGTRDVPMFSEFKPYYEEAVKHRKGGQKYLFECYRKLKDFRSIATLVRKKIIKAGLEPWRLLSDSLRGSCMTRKERSGKFTQKDMDAIFGNSEAIRQSTYIHDREVEDYAGLGGLSDSEVSSDESVKKSPLNSPFSGGFSGFLAGMKYVVECRMMFFDICKKFCPEQGISEDLFNQVMAANSVAGEIATFINSLLSERYDDPPRKVSLLSFLWEFGRNVGKALYLF
ncbi:MAG: site-specific integrase, partial [Planctomycetaceae bacterium]|nr:site-specific integrase [Planctomycetaceae bacterium]